MRFMAHILSKSRVTVIHFVFTLLLDARCAAILEFPLLNSLTKPYRIMDFFVEPDNIWVASSDGNLADVKKLVASGVDVNAQDEYGYSAL